MTSAPSIQWCLDEGTSTLVALHDTTADLVIAPADGKTGSLPGDTTIPHPNAHALAQLDARVLLAFILDCPQSRLYANPEQELTSKEYLDFSQLIKRRASGEPIAYLSGTQEFWSLEFSVSPAVLVPRPDTELLVEQSLELLSGSDSPRLLELGTGSGAIAVAITSEHPGVWTTATDIDDAALEVATLNAETLLGENVRRIRFIKSDWFQHIAPPAGDGDGFDVIVSNPPYLAEDDPHFALKIAGIGFEPRHALASGPGGLVAISHIIEQSVSRLNDNGWLLLEHGYAQAAKVRQLFNDAGYRSVSSKRDLAGIERVTIGKRPGRNASSHV